MTDLSGWDLADVIARITSAFQGNQRVLGVQELRGGPPADVATGPGRTLLVELFNGQGIILTAAMLDPR